MSAIKSALRAIGMWVVMALATPMFGGAVPVTAAGLSHAMTPAVGSSAQFHFLGYAGELGLAPFPCQHAAPAACFGPDQIRAAYGLQPLLSGGATGAGRTIVIIDAFQSPTIQQDLAAFDAIWNLPAPPAFNIIQPDGATPFDPHDGIQLGWSLEISIDVEWAHAIAPGAAIDLVLAKTGADTDMLRATRYAVTHKLNGSRGNLGDVISQSFGESERCAGQRLVAQQHAVFDRATEQGITLIAASGDQGATQLTCDGSALSGLAEVATPASDPDVTSVGGTLLAADGVSGAYQAETAWSGSGGGFSRLFRRPSYQAPLLRGDGRGVPDVAYDADGRSGPIVAWSVLAPPGRVGLGVAQGTSIGAPQWAAIVALADQVGGRRLGAINRTLYQVARKDRAGALHDITTGDNSFGGVTGFPAARGWDAVTGLGTPNVAILLRQLVRGPNERG